MAKKGSISGKRPRAKRGSSGERGYLWVPDQKCKIDNDPFGIKFKMTKSDKLFIEMDHRFTKSLLRSKAHEKDISFITAFKEFKKIQIPQRIDFASVIRPYPSGSCHTILNGDCSTFCATRNLSSF